MRIKAKVVLLVLLAFILGACDSKDCKMRNLVMWGIA